MTKSHIFFITVISILVVVFASCSQKPIQAPAPVEKIPPAMEGKKPSAEAWEEEWDRILSLARKEGVVYIASGSAGTVMTREIFRSSFTKKYGIELIWAAGRTAELSQRIVTERRVGLYTIDVNITGGDPALAYHRYYGFLQPIKPAMILPEVRDESAWLGGKLPFIDSEGMYVLALTLYPQSPFIINTRVVKEEEFSTYANLLNPKWKGKFIANDFTITGSGLKWFGAMIDEDFGPILGLDFMRALSQQNPIIVRDNRIAAEWLIKEKYPFGLNCSIEANLAEYRRQGIPIPPLKAVTPKEGGYLTAGGQVISFFDKAPHPNAARVFINWLLSREGAKALIKATIKDSSRIDISSREIDSQAIIREPGKSYIVVDQEKHLSKVKEYAQLATEIFGHLLR